MAFDRRQLLRQVSNVPFELVRRFRIAFMPGGQQLPQLLIFLFQRPHSLMQFAQDTLMFRQTIDQQEQVRLCGGFQMLFQSARCGTWRR